MKTTRHDDRGDGPVEIMVAVVVLTLATVFGAVGLTGLVTNSHDLQFMATADASLRSDVSMVTAQIQDQPSPLYASCATPATYSPGGSNVVTLDTSSPNYVSKITAVEYFNNSTSPAEYSTTCSSLSPVPQPQLITVQVTYTPTGMVRSTSFAVVNPYVYPLLPSGGSGGLIIQQQPS